jgi:hypothetical protein
MYYLVLVQCRVQSGSILVPDKTWFEFSAGHSTIRARADESVLARTRWVPFWRKHHPWYILNSGKHLQKTVPQTKNYNYFQHKKSFPKLF